MFIIQVSHLTTFYGSRLAVEDVSFQVEQDDLRSAGPMAHRQIHDYEYPDRLSGAYSGSLQVAGYPLPDVRAKSCPMCEQPPFIRR